MAKEEMTESGNVFFPELQDIVCINRENLEKIRTAAGISSLRRARFCLHLSHEDKVQQMVLAFCRDTVVPIHRHTGKSESFHVIEGRLEVLLFDDKGEKSDVILMGPVESGLTFIHRINRNAWHTIRPLTEMVILHEIVAGPYTETMEVLK